MDSQHEDLVAQFSGITGANPSAAQTALESADWNLEQAVSLFYAENEDGQDAPEAYEGDFSDEEPVTQASASSQPTQAPQSQPPSSGPSRRAQGGRPKQMTLDDLKKMQDDEEESDPERNPNMFAGGEKSGLAVQNPGQQGPPDHFRNILSQARQNRDRPPGSSDEAEEPQRSSHFTGRAQTLGGDDAESRVIEDPSAARASNQPAATRVSRTLHLWADGISIDDGPLFRFDDPANQHMMAEINRGRAPLSLLDVQPGQEVDLNLVPHKDENYVQPKKQYKPFGSQGQRLGSPTPGIASTASSSISTAPINAAAASQPAAAISVDESAPTLQLQIRLGDGSRLQSRFNTTHTIGDVYAFVDGALTAPQQRPYALMTTFPSKELTDRGLVLGDIGEFKRGGVVVQKFLGS